MTTRRHMFDRVPGVAAFAALSAAFLLLAVSSHAAEANTEAEAYGSPGAAEHDYDRDDYDDDGRDASDRHEADYRLAERAGDYAGAVQERRGAQARRDRARSQLRNVQYDILRRLEADPRYVEAGHEMDLTRAAYHVRKSAVLDRLNGDEAYRDVRRKAAEVDARLAAAHADPFADPDHLARLARLRLAISSRLSELETQALDADPRIAELRDDYHAALHQYHAIEHHLREELHTHEDIAAALDHLYAAEDELSEARAHAAAARAEFAVAARQYSLDRNSYSPYGYNTYGYNPRGYVQYPPYAYPFGIYNAPYHYGGYGYGLGYGLGYGHHGHHGHHKHGGVTISAFGGPWLKAK